MMSAQEIARILGGYVSGPNSIRAPGPGHSPRDDSLSITLASSAPHGILVNTFSPADDSRACWGYVMDKLGIDPKTTNGHDARAEKKPRVVETYDYETADGAPYLRVNRTNPKGFWQQHWNGSGWIKGAPKGPKIPFRLPELIAAEQEMVLLCEGEKDVLTAVKLGFTATCCSGGAGGWSSGLAAHFRDRDVCIVPHNDDAGEQYAARAANDLVSVARSVQLLRLPNLPPKGGDLTDWHKAGGTGDELGRLVDAAPNYEQATEAPPIAPEPDIKLPLSLDDWAKRDLPPPDFLIGNWLTTTSKTLIAAPTGIGKTNFCIALGMRIAAGEGFLHWQGCRKARVLYIDGEMARRLFKERLAYEEARLGSRPDGFLALSREDVEGFAPLNTPQGRAWLLAFIDKIGDVDLIVFDNVMSLIIGSMIEEEPWAQTLPLVRELTRRQIGQLWVHHTGHDESRAYGTKTREWLLDTVLHMEQVNRDGIDVSFMLSFPKARERTPATRLDFQDVHILLVNDEWQHEPTQRVRAVAVSPMAVKFLDALTNVIASDQVVPMSGGRRAANRDHWEAECAHLGLLDMSKPHSARTLFAKYRRELVAANRIACEGDLTWRL